MSGNFHNTQGAGDAQDTFDLRSVGMGGADGSRSPALPGASRRGPSFRGAARPASAAWSGLCAALLAASPAWALNPIHEASYNLLPRGKSSAPATVSILGVLCAFGKAATCDARRVLRSVVVMGTDPGLSAPGPP